MPNLTENQLSHLVDEARELWLWMEEYRIGHKELYRKESRTSDLMKKFAIGTSFVTIVSTAPSLESIPFLTTGAAIFTAFFTSLTQILSPEKKLHSHWDIIKKIEINQKELTSKARGFVYATSFDKELFYLQRMQQNISQLLTSDIDITTVHKNEARAELEKIRFEPSAQPDMPMMDESDEGMDEAGLAEMPRAAVRITRSNPA